MKKVVFLVPLFFAACATGIFSGLQRIQTRTSWPEGAEVFTLRTQEAEIVVDLSDLQEAIRDSSLPTSSQEYYLGVFRNGRGRDVLIYPAQNDQLADALYALAPWVLRHGDAVVRDLRSGTTVAFILRGSGSNFPGKGEFYCLPDGTEFIHVIVLTQQERASRTSVSIQRRLAAPHFGSSAFMRTLDCGVYHT